ncbi:hypothetical protein LINPERHAP1_LOCUS26688, partial [Linum perenne]
PYLIIVYSMCDADMTKRRRDENATENPREYYKWTDQTDLVLVECMQEMAKQQEVENGQFKVGAFKEMEKMMEVLLVGHGIKANSHIKSRIKVLKKQFQIVQELRGLSGAGWNDELKCVTMEDSSFSEHVQNHSYCSGWNRKSFPLYDGLLAVFGQSRANGKGALDEETNAGFEHQTDNGVDVTADNEKDNGTSACSTSRPKLVPNRRVIDRRGTVESVIADISCDLSEMKPILEKTLETITRIGTGPGESEDVSNKRKALLSKISSIEGLTRAQVFDATMTLCEDEHKTQIFFQLDNNDDRHLFILRLLR